MRKLSLLGLHNDNEQLVLVADDGVRYTLPIDDELRALVRPQHQVVQSIRMEAGANVTVRDIQSMLRAGSNAQDVAKECALPLEHVQRYETPVQDEKNWIISQARDCKIGHQNDAPIFGELVVDRLATRNVDIDRLSWNARRGPNTPWTVELGFIQDARQLVATWEFDQRQRKLIALDSEARWLTETIAPTTSLDPFTRNIVSPVPAVPPEANETVDKVEENSSIYQSTQNILDELAANRGRRISALENIEDDDVSAMQAAVAAGFSENRQPPESQSPKKSEGEEKAEIISLANKTLEKTDEKKSVNQAIDTSASTKIEEGILPGMENLEVVAKPVAKKRSKRRSVPSWDEIVFGSKPE